MTPFGRRVRELRDGKGISLKRMAADLGVSGAYLSALERGHRGRPGPGFVMQVTGYFGLIWDQAEELKELARLSHPRVAVDTANLSPEATELANRLADGIEALDNATVDRMLQMVKVATGA